jgi:hypothetical protein
MKKVALVFLLAVLAPSLVLAWLAVRSLRDQQVVLERQQTLLYQAVVDRAAKAVAEKLTAVQRGFQALVTARLRKREAREAATGFDPELRGAWPFASVGFVVALDGQVLAPTVFDGAAARRFRLENDRFLCNRESLEVYWNSPKGAINISRLDQKEAKPSGLEPGTRGPPEGVPTPGEEKTIDPERLRHRAQMRHGAEHQRADHGAVLRAPGLAKAHQLQRRPVIAGCPAIGQEDGQRFHARGLAGARVAPGPVGQGPLADDERHLGAHAARTAASGQLGLLDLDPAAAPRQAGGDDLGRIALVLHGDAYATRRISEPGVRAQPRRDRVLEVGKDHEPRPPRPFRWERG